MIASFLHHKIERKKKKNHEREREREKKKIMQLSFGPTFREMLTKCYLLWTIQICKCEFTFLGNSQNIPILTDDPLNLPIKTRGVAHPLRHDDEPALVLVIACGWRPGCLTSALAQLLCERERDTHTQTYRHMSVVMASGWCQKAHHSIAELSFVEVWVTWRVCFLGVPSCI
jgi:hypothetical protein